MKINNTTPISIGLVIIIISLGIFKYHISILYTDIFKLILDLLNVSYSKIESRFMFLSKDKDIIYGIGAIFFAPTYLLFHLLLIYSLFYKSIGLVRYLSIGLVGVVCLVAMLTIIFKYFGFIELGTYFHDMFDNLIAKPLILFMVEGGGIIYQYVDKKLN
jgi:hypothetical protein